MSTPAPYPPNIGDVVHQTTTVTLAQMQAAGAVTSANFAIGAPLPANARLVGWFIGSGITSLDDATHATWSASITAVSPGDIMGALNVSQGQSTNARVGTAGAFGIPYSLAGGVQLYLTVSSSVNLSTLTSGGIPVHLFFTVLP